MPVPGPPPGGLPDPSIFACHNPHPTVAVTKISPVLAAISTALDDPDERWKTLKRLRVLRISEFPLGKYELDNQFPKALVDVLVTPRLSHLAILLGVNSVRANRHHLDLDWFGKAYQNFWPGNVGGASLELEVAANLQACIENSFGLANAQSEDPGDWTWANVKGSTWRDDLRVQARPNPVQLPKIEFEWTCHTLGPAVPQITMSGTTLQVSTKWPEPSITLP